MDDGFTPYQFKSAAPQAAPKKDKNFWVDQISTAGGIIGGIGGSFLSPFLGTAAGAAAGSGLGEAIENAITGDKLDKNVVSEAALGGLFGAGPIKLAKGAVGGGLSLLKGAGMAGAKTAATSAAMTPLRQIAGKGLLGAADNLAIKQFRLTPSQLTKFSKKFGEDASTTIRKYGFNTAEDIAEKGIQPLKQQFDSLVTNIPGVTKESLKQSFDGKIAKLLGSGATDNQAIGKQLQKESNQLLKRYGDVIDSKELNAIKNEFDSLVNYTNSVANPAKYGVNKRVADSIRETLQKSDPTGTLKSTGRELQKLYQLSDIASQQSQLGRGSLPLGLGNLMAGGIGGASLGGPGAVTGMLAASAINSPTGRKLALQGAEKIGGKLASTQLNKQTAGGIATRLGTVGVLGSMANQPNLEDALMGQSDTQSISPMTSPMSAPPSSSNISSQYTETPQSSNPFGVSSEQIGQALMQAYIAGDKQAASQLQNMYELASQFEAASAKTADPKLSEAQQARTDVKSLTADALSRLDGGDIKTGFVNAPIQDIAATFGMADQPTLEFNTLISNLKATIAKARAGTSFTEGEKKMLEKYTPNVGDSEQQIRTKLNLLQQQFGGDIPNVTSLQDALLQQQGGQ